MNIFIKLIVIYVLKKLKMQVMWLMLAFSSSWAFLTVIKAANISIYLTFDQRIFLEM